MQPLRIEAEFARPLNFADFDKKAMRKGFRKIGQDVSKIAKTLSAEKGVSLPGQYPGKQTGIFQKSLSYKVSRSGFSVAIKPYLKGKQVSAAFKSRGFYPAFVVYGHAAPKKSKRGKGHAKQSPAGKLVKPRANPIPAAVESYGRVQFQSEVSKILQNAFKPGPIGSLLK
ncbi:hypothetical protein [uncultured Parasutterella sp.]|uniref:hypothetical protein n=1 Tax=uncultured Parasutterella sp. TaxID=1263098 RepID=UPI0025937976|nr:hypothetical protein [uncultured Parasutterella sp.]